MALAYRSVFVGRNSAVNVFGKRATLLALTAAALLPAACGTRTPVTAPPATTAPPPTSAGGNPITVSYFVDGEATLAKLNSSLALVHGGRFDATVFLDSGVIDGTLTIPPSPGTFLGFGFVPVTATATFTAAGDATGTFRAGIADVTAHELLTLSQASVNGTALNVGACRAAQEVDIRIRGTLNLLASSNLRATFTIPSFTGCGVGEDLSPLFDGLVSGPDNQLAVTLTFRCANGQQCPPDN